MTEQDLEWATRELGDARRLIEELRTYMSELEAARVKVFALAKWSCTMREYTDEWESDLGDLKEAIADYDALAARGK